MHPEVRAQIVEHLALRGATEKTAAVKLKDVAQFLDAEPVELIEAVISMQEIGEIKEANSGLYLCAVNKSILA